MKSTLVIESATRKQIDTLLLFLKELGINASIAESDDIDVNSLSIVSETSLAEAWNSEEDEQWDKLYKKIN